METAGLQPPPAALNRPTVTILTMPSTLPLLSLLEARVLGLVVAPVVQFFRKVGLALDEALSRLAVQDPQKAKVVELRFFGGLSVEETADFLGNSPATVKRDWAMSRAWRLGTPCTVGP